MFSVSTTEGKRLMQKCSEFSFLATESSCEDIWADK